MDYSANYLLRASDKRLNIYYNMDKYILKTEASHFTYYVTYFNNVSSRFSKRLHSRPFTLGKSNTRNTGGRRKLTMGIGTHITLLCVT